MIATLTSYDRPLRVAVRAAGQSAARRRGILLTLADDEGHEGHGDAAPLPGGDLGAVAAALAPLLAGPLPDLPDLPSLARWVDAFAGPPAARHALDQAALGLLAAQRGVAVATLLGGDPQRSPPVHRLVNNDAPAGAGPLKLKVDLGDLPGVFDRLARLGADRPLRLDANRTGAVEPLRAALPALFAAGVRVIEDPLAAPTDAALRALRGHGIAIALDEGVDSADAIDRITAAGTADVVVIKPMVVGGLRRAVDLARRAAAADLGVSITSSLETEVGCAGARAVAQCLPEAALASCGIDPFAASCGPAPTRVAALPAVPDPIEAAAQARPDHPALVTDEGATWTWSAVADAAARAAAALAAEGVCAGHRVAIPMRRDHASVIWLFGALRLGAVPVLWPATAAELSALRARGEVHHEVTGQPPTSGPRHPARPWRLEAPRLAIPTSGSTGEPQTVTLKGHQIVLSAFGSAARLGLTPNDRWLCCLPLHHVGGVSILLRAAFAATTVVLHDRFDPRRVAAALDAGQVSGVSLVPEMLARVLDARPEVPFPVAVRAILVGGAATPDALTARAARIGAPLARTWGMTEAGSQVATSWPGDAAPGLPPLALARVEVDDGRLVVDGPLVAARHRTSDLGRVVGGRVFVDGRADTVIVTGGEKVAPASVEAALRDHPAVAEVCVVGLPDARWGQRPHAALVARPRAARPSDADLDAFVRQRIPGFAVPDRFVWVDALPVTALGKPQRQLVARVFGGTP